MSAEHLAGIQALEAACQAVDGGRLKLEYGVLRQRSPEVANDFLWRAAATGGEGSGQLIGFCGIYQNRPTEAEICGMVHPEHRRQGIFTRLLDEALTELRRRGVERVLLIVDRSCEAGKGLALGRAGLLQSSEYRMSQSERPQLQGAHEHLSLRPATTAATDVDFLRECMQRAFGLSEEDIANDDWAARAELTVVIEHAGVPVGVMRVERDPDAAEAGIYGFAVLPELQGRGYGRGALSTVTRALRADGIASVHLEVLVDNPAALQVYESCGFVANGIEDYYLIAL
ncbi:MAG TPA: GNAT family N-acetyltransferase [Acidimicrobiales bacterium]|nr:GNAT family N-acetyltransferase [Acidimicrobiales bacterium]